MRDILIRGMEMPIEQPVTLILDPSGRVWLPDIKTNKEYMARELPPHGDLIDRNELYELVKQRGKNWAGEWCDFECHITGNDIKNAPVIVPANKEDTPNG